MEIERCDQRVFSNFLPGRRDSATPSFPGRRWVGSRHQRNLATWRATQIRLTSAPWAGGLREWGGVTRNPWTIG